MSQITLINENEARYLENDVYKEYPAKETTYEYEQSEHQEFEENKVYYDPPVIHMLRLGDSMQSICKKYNISAATIERANRFEQVTEEILMKRKFVVIPSASTFTGYIFETEQEQIELIKNFCLFFPDVDCEQADYYLGRCNYNLAVAVEQYQFELV